MSRSRWLFHYSPVWTGWNTSAQAAEPIGWTIYGLLGLDHSPASAVVMTAFWIIQNIYLVVKLGQYGLQNRKFTKHIMMQKFYTHRCMPSKPQKIIHSIILQHCTEKAWVSLHIGRSWNVTLYMHTFPHISPRMIILPSHSNVQTVQDCSHMCSQ